MKVKLTQKYIDHPPPVPPDKAKVEHCDTALPGLLWEHDNVFKIFHGEYQCLLTAL
jgi:hypothetical protein